MRGNAATGPLLREGVGGHQDGDKQGWAQTRIWRVTRHVMLCAEGPGIGTRRHGNCHIWKRKEWTARQGLHREMRSGLPGSPAPECRLHGLRELFGRQRIVLICPLAQPSSSIFPYNSMAGCFSNLVLQVWVHSGVLFPAPHPLF